VGLPQRHAVKKGVAVCTTWRARVLVIASHARPLPAGPRTRGVKLSSVGLFCGCRAGNFPVGNAAANRLPFFRDRGACARWG
jgi:hypothetical protein